MLHHKERVRKAAAKKRLATIARKKREEAAQAAREARAAERAAQAKAREEARMAEQEAKRAAKEAERKEREAFRARAKELHLPLQKAKWTERHQAIWDEAEKSKSKAERHREREELEAARAVRREERKARQAAEAVAKAERRKALEEKRRVIREKYGFTLGKKPVTPEEIEGRKRYDRAMLAAERERHREQIREYQKLYRRRRRQQALEEKQTKWTPQQWAAWEKKQASKERGSPQWLVKEVVKHLVAEQNLPEEQIIECLLELGGLDFLIKGAESMGATRCRTKGAVLAAARALALYIDPDGAEMFKTGDK